MGSVFKKAVTRPLPTGAEVVVTLTGLPPVKGIVRWHDDGFYGITFNRILELPVLVRWLQQEQGQLRRAS